MDKKYKQMIHRESEMTVHHMMYTQDVLDKKVINEYHNELSFLAYQKAKNPKI